jgi:hypothetical protein
MFDKIGRYAESVATSAAQSRRGFLGRLGQAALGAASLVGALLLFPDRAGAQAKPCQYCCPDGTVIRHDCPCKMSVMHMGMVCTLCARGICD